MIEARNDWPYQRIAAAMFRDPKRAREVWQQYGAPEHIRPQVEQELKRLQGRLR